MAVQIGDEAKLTFLVKPSDTARALKSGSVQVLATPRLIAWLEAATVEAIAGKLPPQMTSVGTKVDVSHLAASPIGAEVDVTVKVEEVTPHSIYFGVSAQHRIADADRRMIMTGRIARAIVDERRFISGARPVR